MGGVYREVCEGMLDGNGERRGRGEGGAGF